MTVKVHPQEMLDLELLDLSEENPNEQSDDEFSALVEEILEHGFLDPVGVIGPYDDGRYKVFAGEHRFKAARVLEMELIPATVVNPADWEEDARQLQLVKNNVLRGQMNPAKFTDLFNELTKKYDPELLQRMMGFTKQDAFNRLYEDAKAALPPEMQDRLDETRDELKTIDDLSLVLNRLFTEYGDTVKFHAMFFSYGGKEHVMVQLHNHKDWSRVQQFIKWCVEHEVMIDSEIMARINWPHATEDPLSDPLPTS